MRALLASLAVLAAGSGSLWAGTDGLRAFTAEAAWRVEVAADPRPLPAIWLQDQDGRRFRLADIRGRYVLVEFFYTRCLTICSILGSGFARLDRRLLRAGGARDVALVSISLDPRDRLIDLKAYADRERADGQTWRLARATSPDDLAYLLRAFHVVRVPLPTGGFQHNAAIDVFDARGAAGGDRRRVRSAARARPLHGNATLRRASLGAGLFVLLALPPIATPMEALMATHMGLQMPLLLLAGYGLGADLATRQPAWLRACNANGAAGTLLAGFTLIFWMLPRWLDGALENPAIELAKFLTLPLLAGLPLALSWGRLPVVLRGFLQLNALSMLGFMGWLYLVAPNRLCNNYLLDQQALLGWSLLAWTGVLALVWAARPLFGRRAPRP